jgi:tetratricopeptide (TPR) repeat protein
LINQRKLDSASILSQQALVDYPHATEAHYAAGKINMLSGEISVAISFYEKLLEMPRLKTYTKSWALHDLATCYFALGNSEKAESFLNSSLQLKATKNVINSAGHLSKVLGFDSLFHSWKRYETDHFVFHFQTASDQIKKVALRKEQAFTQINSFFNAKLPKKIDYFVWSDEKRAQIELKRQLAFTDPGLSLTHTSATHTVGHEMTHTISHFAVKISKSHKLISEGLCVNFDLSNRDNIDALKKLNFKASIEAIWKNEIPATNDIIYPLGGELVKRLIKSFGREKFFLLLSDQTYQNATKIYGSDLKTLIQEIEGQIK